MYTAGCFGLGKRSPAPAPFSPDLLEPIKVENMKTAPVSATAATGICLFLVCFLWTGICSANRAQIFNEGDLSDYPPLFQADNEQDTGYADYQRPEVIRQQSGTDMVLKCNTTSCLYHKHKITWEFKACQPDFKKTPCTKLYESTNKEKDGSWDKADGHVVKKKCLFNLYLEATTENHSGLYRCIEDNKLIKTYEVQVVDLANPYRNQPPELLDVIPSNMTVDRNMQIRIQCKVYSKQPPVILWFKQSDSSNYDIQYSKKFYSRINISAQVYAIPHELNIYLSKLNIYHAREVDSGVYVCVAMTESGKDYKDATVTVISSENCWEPHSSFFLLFLIPFVFALIPVTVWLCYYRKKKKMNGKVRMRNYERHLIRPMLSNTIVSSNRSTLV